MSHLSPSNTQAPTDCYPQTRRGDIVEDLHGHRVSDPYRWLEDSDTAEVTDWVRRQNAFTEAHLAELAERATMHEIVSGILSRPRAGMVLSCEGTYLVHRNDGSQNQDAWFVADTLDELRTGGRLLLEPDAWSEDGTTSVLDVVFRRDGKVVTCAVSEGGADWSWLRHVDVRTGMDLPDTPVQVKGLPPTWLPDNGSYVYAVPGHSTPMNGTEPSAVGPWELRLHRVGEVEERTLLTIHERPRSVFYPITVSHDDRYLVVTIADGTEPARRLWLYPLSTAGGRTEIGEPIALIDEAVALFAFVRVDGNRLIVRTDLDAGRGQVIAIGIDESVEAGELVYDVLVPEAEGTLTEVLAAGDELVTVRTVAGSPAVDRYDLTGRHLGVLRTPPGALALVVKPVSASPSTPEYFLAWSTLTQECLTLRGLAGTNELELLDDFTSTGTVSRTEVTVTWHQARSADGTMVPFAVARPESCDPDEARPTLLYGYGGFNLSIAPTYLPILSAWLEAGGTVAVANIRGGGERRIEWYENGRGPNKQNGFDDFIGVGEELIARGVTPVDGLVIHGASNGGLLVGAVITQRPDLIRVALPDAAVLDMLRFHLFTFGAAWISDYGDPDSADDFEVALDYSPVHNVKRADYPAVLVTTGDHDDRVVPSHSFKFVAELQRMQQGSAPVLIRVVTGAGHVVGKSVAQLTAEISDQLAFAAHHAGLYPMSPARR